MKLLDVLNTLQSGELSNLSLFNENGSLKPEHKLKLLTSINLGLTDLHTRFLLKIGKIKINLIEGQVTYPLKPMYQIGNTAPAGTVQFISDETGKMRDNLLKVNQVLDGRGCELGLNNHDARRGVYTNTYNVLGVTTTLWKDYDERQLTVVYRMNANLLKDCGEWDDFAFDCLEVDLDYSHLYALCLFVASRLHMPQGFGPETVHEGNNYWGKYLAECARIEEHGLRIDDVALNTKRLQKGFP